MPANEQSRAQMAKKIPDTVIDAVTIAGMGHNFYQTPDTHPDEPNVICTQVAKRFITLFDKAIEEMGFQLLMGSELEFQIRKSKKTDKALGEKGYGKLEDTNNDKGTFNRLYENAVGTHLKEVDSSVDGSNPDFSAFKAISGMYPKIFTAHKEACKGQYEIATSMSHPADHPRRVEWLKEALFESSYEARRVLGYTANDPSPKTLSQEIHQTIYPGALRFRAESRHIRSGEHMNVSIHEHPKKLRFKDRIEGSYNNTTEYASTFCEVLAPYANHDRLLHYNGMPTLERQKDITYSRARAEEKVGKIHSLPTRALTHIEFKQYDAGANPYLTTLSTIALFYIGLHTIQQAKEHMNQPPQSLRYAQSAALEKFVGALMYQRFGNPISNSKTTYDSMKDHFENDSVLLPLMEEVAAKYGTREDFEMIEQFKHVVMDRAERLHALPKEAFDSAAGHAQTACPSH